MAKNIQLCMKCGKKIEGEYRMVLMNGNKGFRRYAVHPVCAGNVSAGNIGGRQRAAMSKKAGA